MTRACGDHHGLLARVAGNTLSLASNGNTQGPISSWHPAPNLVCVGLGVVALRGLAPGPGGWPLPGLVGCRARGCGRGVLVSRAVSVGDTQVLWNDRDFSSPSGWEKVFCITRANHQLCLQVG